jgi:hypothetical protein
MQGTLQTYQGSCHCGAVRFGVKSTLTSAIRCNCSLCRRKGTIIAPVSAENFRLLRGEDHLTLYQFNTKVAKHYFCNVCGIHVFHRPRMAPETYRVNIGCLEDVDPFSIEVGLNDGASFSTVSPG